MKYVSIDLETTGLDPKTSQILEFGAVVDDLANPKPIDALPKFHCYVKHPEYHGAAKALSMHTHILQRIADEEVGYQYYTLSDMSERFRMFLRHHGFDTHYGINVAGKNFAMFDRQFLLANPHWSIKFTHRVLDPAILFWKPGDDKLPDMRTCLDRAGFTDRVTHNAVDDAILVVKLLRKGLNIPQITVV